MLGGDWREPQAERSGRPTAGPPEGVPVALAAVARASSILRRSSPRSTNSNRTSAAWRSSPRSAARRDISSTVSLSSASWAVSPGRGACAALWA